MHTDISLKKAVETGVYRSLYELGMITSDEFAMLRTMPDGEEYE